MSQDGHPVKEGMSPPIIIAIILIVGFIVILSLICYATSLPCGLLSLWRKKRENDHERRARWLARRENAFEYENYP
jgi:hypothetical protein